LLAAVLGHLEDLDRSGLDDEEAIARITFSDQHLLLAQSPGYTMAGQGCELMDRQNSEERHAPQSLNWIENRHSNRVPDTLSSGTT
jgi:hypothetical protein